MKKIQFSPLKMDKKTIAKLDAKQLEKIKGGVVGEVNNPTGTTTRCHYKSCRQGNSCNHGHGSGDGELDDENS